MNIDGWILTLILMLVIPFALATLGNLKSQDTSRFDVSIFLCSLAIMIIYLIYIETLETFTLIFAILIMAFMFFGTGGSGEK